MSPDNSSYIRELKRAEQQEKDYLKKRAKRKTTLLNSLAEDRVPKGIQSKLNEAFCKAFQVIFDRGMPAVERTINRRGIENRWEENIHHAQILRDTSSIRNITREATKDSMRGMLLSGASGVGLGVLGIGLPDVPVFAGMIMRDVNIKVSYREFEFEGTSFRITITAGVEEYDFRSELVEIIEQADRKLYVGKTSGRNCVIV